MAARRSAVVLGVVVAQVVLLVATFGTRIGTAPWHHLASLGAVLFASALLWRPLVSSRRFLALGVFASSLLATASGFWLLYWKEGIRVDGYQDWGVFWHIAWSWAMLVFFILHTWINRVAWSLFMRRSFARLGPAAMHAGAYLLLVAAFAVTWSAIGRDWFTNENYVQLSLYAWVLVVVPPYLLWSWTRLRSQKGGPSWLRHWPVRSTVDLALVPSSALAMATGIVLAFFDPQMDALGLKYASKYWHVWPSVLFAMLAFVHTVQAWPTVAAHWRSLGRRSARPHAARDAGPAPPEKSSG